MHKAALRLQRHRVCVGTAALLLVLAAGGSARGAPIMFDAKVGDDVIGSVKMEVSLSPLGDSLRGFFDFTKTKPDGSIIDHADLKELFGIDHLNWFQKVIKNTNVTEQFPARFIDPQRGGQGRLWADEVPWYWNEVPTPAAKEAEEFEDDDGSGRWNPGEKFTDSNGNGVWDPDNHVQPAEPLKDTNGNGTRDGDETFTDTNKNGRWDPARTVPPTTPTGNKTQLAINQTIFHSLEYIDDPGGQPIGTVVDFVTFLVADYGNKKYAPLQGFSWSIKIRDDRKTQVTALKAGEAFVGEYADEIKNDFGYHLVPEPSTWLLVLCGVISFSARNRGRILQHSVRRAGAGHASRCRDLVGAACGWLG